MAQGFAKIVGKEFGDGQIVIWPWEYSAINGTWTLGVSSGIMYGTYYYNSTDAVGDYLEWKLTLSVATYQIVVCSSVGTNRGWAHLLIDGVRFGWCDTYAAGNTIQQNLGPYSFYVAEAGIKTLKVLVGGRNIYSTNNFFLMNNIFIARRDF